MIHKKELEKFKNPKHTSCTVKVNLSREEAINMVEKSNIYHFYECYYGDHYHLTTKGILGVKKGSNLPKRIGTKLYYE